MVSAVLAIIISSIHMTCLSVPAGIASKRMKLD